MQASLGLLSGAADNDMDTGAFEVHHTIQYHAIQYQQYQALAHLKIAGALPCLKWAFEDLKCSACSLLASENESGAVEVTGGQERTNYRHLPTFTQTQNTLHIPYLTVMHLSKQCTSQVFSNLGTQPTL